MKTVAVAVVLLIVGVGIWIYLMQSPMTPTLPEIGPGAHPRDGGTKR